MLVLLLLLLIGLILQRSNCADVITTIAGTGTANFSGDNGQATSATLSYPLGIAIDASDNVYICDMGNQRIRKVTVSTGIITTVAGSTTSVSYSGDGGAATSATLNYPHGIWVTSGMIEAVVPRLLCSNPLFLL